jgi:hypothetical protein
VANQEQANHNASYAGFYREGASYLRGRRKNNHLARACQIAPIEIGNDHPGDGKEAHVDRKHHSCLNSNRMSLKKSGQDKPYHKENPVCPLF